MWRSWNLISQYFINIHFIEFVKVISGALFKYDHILIFSKDLEAAIPDLSSAQGPYVRKGAPGDIERGKKQINKYIWEFNCGDHDNVNDFFVYEQDGIIKHISWVYYQSDPNRIIKLARDEAEIKYSFTVEMFRGQSIYAAILVYIQKYLKERRYKRLFICASGKNVPSIRGIEKAGFIKTASLYLIKIFGVQMSRRFKFPR